MTWVTKQEYRQSNVGVVGLTLNAAFLREIKEDNVAFRQLLDDCLAVVSTASRRSIRDVTDKLLDLRDELETYFALEEFYGYFRSALEIDSSVSVKAHALEKQHEDLFVHLCGIVDHCEQLLYGEAPPELTLKKVASEFTAFYQALIVHEQAEHELLIKLNNQDTGGGAG